MLFRSVAKRVLDPPPVCSRVESIVIWGTSRIGQEAQVNVGPFLANLPDDMRTKVKAFPVNFGLIELDASQREELARRDGFDSFAEMIQFFEGRLPFYGHIFHWQSAGKRCECKHWAAAHAKYFGCTQCDCKGFRDTSVNALRRRKAGE